MLDPSLTVSSARDLYMIKSISRCLTFTTLLLAPRFEERLCNVLVRFTLHLVKDLLLMIINNRLFVSGYSYIHARWCINDNNGRHL